jgi:protocatechuate 3,4-dioxygenase beta subunit
MFYLFTQNGGSINSTAVNVPVFSTGTQVVYTIAGTTPVLNHITVTPSSTSVNAGGTVPFTAQGYDVNNNPISGLTFTWAANAGGTISQSGVFTAGSQAGVYSNAVTASCNGISGSASVTVNVPTLTSFSFAAIASPQSSGTAFAVMITAYDQNGNVLTSYAGKPVLSDTTGTISPTSTGSFTNGVWQGNVTISKAATGVTIKVTDGSVTGTSNSFTVAGGTASQFVFSTISSPQTNGTAFAVTITACDQNGNAVTSFTGDAKLTDSLNSISPKTTASFTNGVWQGNLTISKTGNNVTIKATDGTITGTSNDFNVQAKSRKG